MRIGAHSCRRTVRAGRAWADALVGLKTTPDDRQYRALSGGGEISRAHKRTERQHTKTSCFKQNCHRLCELPCWTMHNGSADCGGPKDSYDRIVTPQLPVVSIKISAKSVSERERQRLRGSKPTFFIIQTQLFGKECILRGICSLDDNE